MLLLLCFAPYAASGVKNSLNMCFELILPSLFPFFVGCSLMNETGLSIKLGQKLSPLAAKLFGVSGVGATAFITGVTGGYPLGAAYIADLRKRECISSNEASHLLSFCNNSGPAFIIGAAGYGIYSSVKVGFFLYFVHILSAMIYGVIIYPKAPFVGDIMPKAKNEKSFSSAVTASVKSAITTSLSVCGFIMAFAVLSGILTGTGILYQIAGEFSQFLGAELQWCRVLLFGIIELGNGIGCMAGLSINPLNLALTAFLLGFGGVSVLFQTYAMISGTDIKAARYIIGRLFVSLLGGSIALLGSFILF